MLYHFLLLVTSSFASIISLSRLLDSPMLWDWVTGKGRAQQVVLGGGLFSNKAEGKCRLGPPGTL